MDMVAGKMGYFLDSSDSMACRAWDMLDRLVEHQEENEQAREGTYDAETDLGNILDGLVVFCDPRQACHLDK